MRRMLLAVALAAGTGGGVARAQSAPDKPMIVVTGTAEASAAPDFYVIDGVIRGEAADRLGALSALKSRQEKIFGALGSLEGAERIAIQPEKLRVNALYPKRCEDAEDEGLQESGECAAIGYAVYLPVEIRVRPADMVGRAASLATELGMDSVRMDEGGVDDPARLRAEAHRLAFEDARRQAEALAASASVKLGPLVRLQHGTGRYDFSLGASDVEEVVVVGSRVRAKIELSVTPEPVTASATVTAVFEIVQ